MSMYNSHKDIRFSLALNILDGCLQLRRLYQDKYTFGQDINETNAQAMFTCAYQLADSMYKAGVKGLYFELAPALFLQKAVTSTNATQQSNDDKIHTYGYFDPIRRLSLLPEFISKRIKGGTVALPFGVRYARVMRSDFWAVNKEPFMMSPISYMETDPIFLCPEEDQQDTRMLDVFKVLSDPIGELLGNAVEGLPFPAFTFPRTVNTIDRWLNWCVTRESRYDIPAVLYLLHFFPYRCSALISSKPSVNVKYILDALGAETTIGDSMEFMQIAFLPLLKYGPIAIRLWIRDLTAISRVEE